MISMSAHPPRVARAPYTDRIMFRHYRRLWLAITVLLLWPMLEALACSAEPRGVTIDPARSRGPAEAAVTVVEFADYQCPYCRRAQSVLDQLMREFKGKLRLVYKDLPAPSHAGARPAAEAARCAAARGVFWEYHDLLFLASPDFSRDHLIQYAERLALERDAFAACLDARHFREQVDADVSEARALGIRETPTFLINGKPLVGALPIETFREAITEALREAGAR